MNDLILIGSGGHCRSVIDVIEQEDKFKIAGLVDKLNSKVDNISGYPVIGYDRDLKNLVSKYKYAFIAVGQIGSPELRIDLFKSAKKRPGPSAGAYSSARLPGLERASSKASRRKSIHPLSIAPDKSATPSFS